MKATFLQAAENLEYIKRNFLSQPVRDFIIVTELRFFGFLYLFM